jgi:iron complex outermembrane recepter protein
MDVVRRWIVRTSLPLFAIAAAYDFGRAQMAAPNSGAESPQPNLAPVTVSPPPKRKASEQTNRHPSRTSTTRSVTARSKKQSTTVVPSGAPPTATQPRETGFGPVSGYVAHQSATGTKTDTPIIETPQSISVVPNDQLEAQQVWTAKEALRYTAGAVYDTRGNFSAYDIIYNRGFIVNRYLDGMRLQGDSGFVTPQVQLYDTERVELLRGPASVLFGQGSPGGIVNMVSKRPTASPFGEVELQAGSFDRLQGAFDIGGPIDPAGQFDYRLTGLVLDSDNQVNFVKEQREFIAPAFTWRTPTHHSRCS